MRIAHISDSHIIEPNVDKIGYERLLNLEKCIIDINSLSPPPDLVIHTGDITHNGKKKEFELAYKILKKIKYPFYLTPGNKDKSNNFISFMNANNLINIVGSYAIYSVNLFPIQFISFDTVDCESKMGLINKEKLLLLKKELEKNPNKPTIIFMHHPPFKFNIGNKNYNEFTTNDAIFNLKTLLLKFPLIYKIISGHIHRNHESKINNTECNTVPSIALDLRYGDYSNRLVKMVTYSIYSMDNNYNFKIINRWI